MKSEFHPLIHNCHNYYKCKIDFKSINKTVEKLKYMKVLRMKQYNL